VRFIRDRLLRLGVPFAVFAVLLWPLWSMSCSAGWERPPGSGLSSVPRAAWTLGFVVRRRVLIFSLAYAGWVWVRRGHEARPWLGEIKVSNLLLLAAAASVATFLVRLMLPFESEHVGMARVRGAVRTGHHGISCGVADGRSGPPTPTESDCDSHCG
jgi:hypothetical protein